MKDLTTPCSFLSHPFPPHPRCCFPWSWVKAAMASQKETAVPNFLGQWEPWPSYSTNKSCGSGVWYDGNKSCPHFSGTARKTAELVELLFKDPTPPPPPPHQTLLLASCIHGLSAVTSHQTNSVLLTQAQSGSLGLTWACGELLGLSWVSSGLVS